MITISKKIYWHVFVYTTDSIPDPDSGIQDGQIGTLDTSASGDITGSYTPNILAYKNCSIVRTFDLTLDASSNVTDITGVRANNSVVGPGKIIFNLSSSELIDLFGNPVIIDNISKINDSSLRQPLRYALFATYNSLDSNCADSSAPDSWFDHTSIPDSVATGDQASQLSAEMAPYLDQSQTGLDAGFFFQMKAIPSITKIGCCDISPSGSASSSSSLSSSSSSSSSSSDTFVAQNPIRRRTFDSTSNFDTVWIVRQFADFRISSERYSGKPMPAELLYGIFNINTPDTVEWKHAGFINFGEQLPLSYSNILDPDSLIGSDMIYAEPISISIGRTVDPRSSLPIDIQDIFWDSRGFLWAYCSGDTLDSGLIKPDGSIEITATTEGIYRLLPGGYKKSSVDILTFGADEGSHNYDFYGPIDGRCSKISCGDDFTILLGEKYGEIRFIKSNISLMPSPSNEIINKNGIKDVSAGKDHGCIVDVNGRLFAWSSNVSRSCVNGPNISTANFSKVACGDGFTIGLTTNNILQIWDDNNTSISGDLVLLMNSINADSTLNSYAYVIDSIKAKNKMAAIRLLISPSDGSTPYHRIAVWGSYEDNSLIGFSANTSGNFYNEFDYINIKDFSCGYHNFALIKSDEALLLTSDTTAIGNELLNESAAFTGFYNNVSLSKEACCVTDSSQNKVLQFYTANYGNFLDQNNNSKKWLDGINSYQFIDSGLNHFSGQTQNGYMYKYYNARLVERSFIDLPSGISNVVYPIAKLQFDPIEGLDQSINSKFLDGASFNRIANTGSSDILIGNMPIYINDFKTIRNFQWMYKPYKLIGSRTTDSGNPFYSQTIQNTFPTCIQNSGSLRFNPIYYKNGSIQNDGFDFVFNGNIFQNDSKVKIENSILNVDVGSSSYNISNPNQYLSANLGSDRMYIGVSQNNISNLTFDTYDSHIFDNFYLIEGDTKICNDIGYTGYIQTVGFKNKYKILSSNFTSSNGSFIGNRAPHLSGVNIYSGIVDSSKVQILKTFVSGDSSAYASRIRNISQIPGVDLINRDAFYASAENGEYYDINALGNWPADVSAKYLNGISLPYTVIGIKPCVSPGDLTVFKRLAYDNSSANNIDYSFSMDWRDHVGSLDNEYIGDISGTEITANNNFGRNMGPQATNNWTALNMKTVVIPHVAPNGTTDTKMTVIDGREIGCVFDYNYDINEIPGGSTSYKIISCCSKLITKTDYIVGFWRVVSSYSSQINPFLTFLSNDHINSVINCYSFSNSAWANYQPTIGNLCAHKASSDFLGGTLNYIPSVATTPIKEFIFNKCFITFEFKVQNSPDDPGTVTKYPFSKYRNFSSFGSNKNFNTFQKSFLAIDIRELLEFEVMPGSNMNFAPYDLVGSSFIADHLVGIAWNGVYGGSFGSSNIAFYHSDQNSHVFNASTYNGGIGYWRYLFGYVSGATGQASSSVVIAGFPSNFLSFCTIGDDTGQNPKVGLIPKNDNLPNQSKIIRYRLIERASKCIILKTHDILDSSSSKLVFISVNRIYNIDSANGLPVIPNDDWNDTNYYSSINETINNQQKPLIIGDGVKIEFADQNGVSQGFVWTDGNLYWIRHSVNATSSKPVVQAVQIVYNYSLSGNGSASGASGISITRNRSHIREIWKRGNLNVISNGQYLIITNSIKTSRTQGVLGANDPPENVSSYSVIYKITINYSGTQATPVCSVYGFINLDSYTASYNQDSADPAPGINGGLSSQDPSLDNLSKYNSYNFSLSATISKDGRDVFVSKNKILTFTGYNSSDNPIFNETICFSYSLGSYSYKNNYTISDPFIDGTSVNLLTNPLYTEGDGLEHNISKIGNVSQVPDISGDLNSNKIISTSSVGIGAEGSNVSFVNVLNYNRSVTTAKYLECENILADPTIVPTQNNAFANYNFWCATPISSKNGYQSASSYGNDVYLTSGGASICITPQPNSNNWSIKAINSRDRNAANLVRFTSSFQDLAEGICSNSSLCNQYKDIFSARSPLYSGSNSSEYYLRKESDCIRAMTSVAYNSGASMLCLAHNVDDSYTTQYGISDYLRIYNYIPYFKYLNETGMDSTVYKFDPMTRLFINKFVPFVQGNSSFGISNSLSVSTINYFNMIPDFKFSGTFTGYESSNRSYLTSYMGLMEADFSDSNNAKSASAIMPRFGRDAKDQEGAVVSMVDSDVGCMAYVQSYQNANVADRNVIIIRDTYKIQLSIPGGISDSSYTESAYIPSNEFEKSSFYNNSALGGSVEILKYNPTSDALFSGSVIQKVFIKEATDGNASRPLLSRYYARTRGGCGSSSIHPDISNIQSTLFPFSNYYEGRGVASSPVGIFIDDCDLNFSYPDMFKLSVVQELIENPDYTMGIPDLFNSQDANNIWSKYGKPISKIKNNKIKYILDTLNGFFDPNYGEIYYGESISISTLQSIRDVYVNSVNNIFGYSESLSNSVYLKSCREKSDLHSIRNWINGKLSYKLGSSASTSSLLFCLDANIANIGGNSISPGPIMQNSIVSHTYDYNNVVFITGAANLGINAQYWGYLEQNREAWVTEIVQNLRNTIMSNTYGQIHIIDLKPDRDLSVNTEILQLIAEKSGGVYIPILTDLS